MIQDIQSIPFQLFRPLHKLLYTISIVPLGNLIHMMKTYQGNYFTASIPDTWDSEFDNEAGIDVLYNENGHGEVQISSVIHDEELTPNDLMHIAEEDLHAGATLQELDLGEFHGFWFDYATNDDYWCEWYLCCGQLMLFATYNCSLEDEGKEYDAIEKIIESLLPSDNSHSGT